MDLEQLSNKLFDGTFTRSGFQEMLNKHVCTKEEALIILNNEAEMEGREYNMNEFEKYLKRIREVGKFEKENKK